MRNNKLKNSSLVGHLSFDMLVVVNVPGAVAALCFWSNIALFIKFSFERDFGSSFFIPCLEELLRSLLLKFVADKVPEHWPQFISRRSFWLSKSDIFRWIRFKISEGFLLPKYGSSTLVQPFFLPGNSMLLNQSQHKNNAMSTSSNMHAMYSLREFCRWLLFFLLLK